MERPASPIQSPISLPTNALDEESERVSVLASEWGSRDGEADPSCDPNSNVDPAFCPINSNRAMSIPILPQLSQEDSRLSTQWEGMLSTVQTFARPRHSATLPWERGFAARVFGSFQPSNWIVKLPYAPLPTSLGSIDTAQEPKSSSILTLDSPGAWPVVINRVNNIGWDDFKEMRRSRASLLPGKARGNWVREVAYEGHFSFAIRVLCFRGRQGYIFEESNQYLEQESFDPHEVFVILPSSRLLSFAHSGKLGVRIYGGRM